MVRSISAASAEQAGDLTRFLGAVIVAVAGFAGGTAVAQDECGRCLQNHTYVCTDNYGLCMTTCRSVTTTDKDGCQRRCLATDDACSRRAARTCGVCRPDTLANPPPRRIQ